MNKAVENKPSDKLELIVPTDAQKKAQRNRSIGLALALVAFVVVVYVGTVVKMGANLFHRPM